MLAALNEADVDTARVDFLACCADPGFADAMAGLRPFATVEDLSVAGRTLVAGFDDARLVAVVDRHDPIGIAPAGSGTTATWSRLEQAGVLAAEPDVLRSLAELGERYRERFGCVFLIRASGLRADEVLAALTGRLDNSRAAELARIRGELAGIVALRLTRLVTDRRTRPVR